MTRSLRRIGGEWVPALALTLAASNLVSQQPIRVTRNTPCPGCRIVEQRVLSLGTKDGPGALGSAPWLACRTGGPYFAVTMSRPGEIIVFDANGNFQRTVGRKGQGPAEYQMIFPIRVGPGDSVFVFDGFIRRLTVLSPSLELVRSAPIPGLPRSVVLFNNGSLVAQIPLAGERKTGLPLHLLDASGTVRKSFGAVHPNPIPTADHIESRKITDGGGGSVWSARPNEYRLERWDTSGVLRRVLDVPTPWFKRWEDRPPGVLRPVVAGLQRDAEGLLWVLLLVPDPKYKEGAAGGASAVGKPANFNESAKYDSIVEVIDPDRAVVLAARRFDDELRGFACVNTVFRYHEDDEGVPSIRVYSLRLARSK